MNPPGLKYICAILYRVDLATIFYDSPYFIMRVLTTTILSTSPKNDFNYIIDSYVFFKDLGANHLERTLDFLGDIPSTLYHLYEALAFLF